MMAFRLDSAHLSRFLLEAVLDQKFLLLPGSDNGRSDSYAF